MSKQNKDNKLQIRNSTAEFLIFTHQSGGEAIEVRVQDGTVWLNQKLIASLITWEGFLHRPGAIPNGLRLCFIIPGIQMKKAFF